MVAIQGITDDKQGELFLDELEQIYLISGWRQIPEKAERAKEIEIQLNQIFLRAQEDLNR